MNVLQSEETEVSLSCELGALIQISGVFGEASPKLYGINICKSIVVSTTILLLKI